MREAGADPPGAMQVRDRRERSSPRGSCSRGVWRAIAIGAVAAPLTACAPVDAPSSTPAETATGAEYRACESVATEAGSAPDPSGAAPLADVPALRIVREIAVPADPVALGFGAGAVWVVSMGGGTLSRIDPATGAVTASVELGDALGYGALAVDDAGVRLAQMGDATLSVLDPATLASESSVALGEVPDRPYSVAVDDDGTVWVADQSAHTVTRLDPGTGEPGPPIDVRPGGAEEADFSPSGIALDDDAVWVVEHRADALTRIDGPSGEVTDTVCLGSPDPVRLAVTDGAVWVSDTGGVVSRIAQRTLEVEARVGPLYGPLAAGLAAGDGSVWVANASHLVRIDAASNEVDGAVLLSEQAPAEDDAWPGGLAVTYGGGSAWVTHPASDSILQVTGS